MTAKPPLRAGVFAKILAELRGPEAGGFGIAVVSAVILVISILCATFKRTPEATLGAGLGSIGLVLSIAYLYFAKTRWGKTPTGTSLAVTEADGRTISIRTPSSADAAILLREALQGRKPLPAPFGEVTGDPADPNALRPYSPEEGAASAAETRRQIEESERRFVENLPLDQVIPPATTPLGVQDSKEE